MVLITCRNLYKRLVTIIVCLFVFGTILSQQQNPATFGKVKKADFDLSSLIDESLYDAVIISDVGKVEYGTNARGGFDVIFKRQTRLKILKESALDAGNVFIDLYKDDQGEETILEVNANSYNLDKNTVIKKTLDKKSVFRGKTSANYTRITFAIPDVRVGSIIEVKYEIISGFIMDIRPWYFQNRYFTIWSEYEAEIPGILEYYVSENDRNYFLNKQEIKTRVFNITRSATTLIAGSGYAPTTSFDFTMQVKNMRWVKRMLPYIKPEKLVWSVDRSRPKIEFLMSRISMSGISTSYNDSWTMLSQRLMMDENFGAQLYKPNNWIDDQINKLKEGVSDSLLLAKRIFNYIRDNFSCIGTKGIWLSGTLKEVFENRRGNVADINLLLVAALRKAGFSAWPVLLCTRSGGGLINFYPSLNKIDYVIGLVTIGNGQFYLDACDQQLGFNKLKLDCFNGMVRIIDEFGTRIMLNADSISENKHTSLFLTIDNKGTLAGTFETKMGYYESYETRKLIKKIGVNRFLSEFRSVTENDCELSDIQINGLNELEEVIVISGNLSYKEANDFFYLKPMLLEDMNENPFAASERMFPIDFPSRIFESYEIKLDIPKNWTLEEVPQSAFVKLYEDERTAFDYNVARAGNSIVIKTFKIIERANFSLDEFSQLKEFFSRIIKKQSELIVIKKN